MTEERHLPEDLQREAASLVHLIGGVGSKHLIVVGGLLPPLLAPEAEALHAGSRDIDFCFSVALTEGHTREYYRSIEEQIAPYFEPLNPGSTFRWIKKSTAPGLPIVVDFLAPEDPEDPLAKAEGVRDLSDQTAADNTGTRLRPFPLRAGSIIDRDAEIMVVDIELVHRPGVRAEVQLRYAGPVGFLVAKANAFNGREDTKDGYDVSWWCLNAAPTAAKVANLVTSRPAFQDPFVPEAIHMLQAAFKGPDYMGPTGYAQEIHPDLGPGDDAFEQDRNLAYSRVSEVIEHLRQAIDWDKLKNGS